jgi:hypothetical protein
MRVDEASALEETLARLRQRYALHFYLPEGANAADRDAVRVDLSRDARLRYQDAEVHYRRVFLSGNAGERSGPTVVTRAPDPSEAPVANEPATDQRGSSPPKRRRVAVNEDSGDHINTIDSNGDSTAQQPAAPASPPSKGGWPRADGTTSQPH